MKILVVDDDKFNLSVAEGYLQFYFPGYEIFLCQSPKLVMRIIYEKQIDIVLLDIAMPEINGIDVLKEIRSQKEYRDIQIIMLTAIVDLDSFKTCFELGANDYLTKPIDTTEFQARIKASATTRSNSKMLHEMYERMRLQNNQLKNVNVQLRDAQFHLIQSEKLAAIGELAAGVAHEINNPIGYIGSNLETMESYLNKMHSFIDFCMEQLNSMVSIPEYSQNDSIIKSIHEKYIKSKIKFISDDLESIIKDSQEGIQKISGIVKSLRNFARAGNEDEKNYCSVLEIIEQVLLIIRNESKYAVEIKLGDFNTQEVYCNKGQLGQVLLNILLNAIQAIKSQNRAEHGNIFINAYTEDDYICISIKDDGPGIPEENLTKIFIPFFTTKEVGQGTGLGLSISHDIIVNKHKGLLDVKSFVGIGTEFIIKLPGSPEKEEVLL